MMRDRDDLMMMVINDEIKFMKKEEGINRKQQERGSETKLSPEEQSRLIGTSVAGTSD